MRSHGDNLKIWLVDDSPASRKLVESALSQKPSHVLVAATGGEAIRLLEEHDPAVVIMGWCMPDFTGEEFRQRIRSRSRSSYTYVIVLTGRSDKECLIQALDAGADDYLTKPFDRAELLARVGVALRITELYRETETKNALLEELALTDALTDLPNRRAIEDWAATQWSNTARHKYSFSVLPAGLDHFKQVNDTFGHEAADEVLKKFLEILNACTRRSDLCGRLGCEEFLLVPTHRNKENPRAVIERIRTELANTPFAFHGCTSAVTASLGLAGFEASQNPSTFSRLQALADAALCSAKREGRNPIECTPALAY